MSLETAGRVEAAASALVQMATNEKLLLLGRKHEELLYRAENSGGSSTVCQTNDTGGGMKTEETTPRSASLKSFSECNITQLFSLTGIGFLFLQEIFLIVRAPVMLFRCIRMLHGRAPGQRDSKQRWIARVR